MLKSKRRHHNYDLQADLERIKSAFNDAAQDVKGKATDTLLDTYENAKLKSVELRGRLGDYAKEEPVKTIAFAMFSGFLLGLFWRK